MRTNKLTFESFIISPEPTKSHEPLKIVAFAKSISKKLDRKEVRRVSFSARFLDRFVITCEDALLRSLSEKDFVEVLDYDPTRRTAVVIGRNYPSLDTPLHWLTFRIEPSAKYVVFIRCEEPDENLNGSEKFPIPEAQTMNKKHAEKQIKQAKSAGLGFVEYNGDTPSLLSAGKELKGKKGVVTLDGILLWDCALENLENRCLEFLAESSNNF